MTVKRKKKFKRKKLIKKFIITKIIKLIIVFLFFTISFIIISKILKIHYIFDKFKKKNNNNNKINKINSSEGRIFLCTLYNNEAEAAYIHIWRLYNYVDKFIIVISNLTHSGKPKVFSLEPFEKNIKPFMDKIDFAFFVYSSNNFKSGIRERMQRDYAKTYIEEKYNPTEKDLLIVVDIDEILTREGIEYIKNNPPNHFKFIKLLFSIDLVYKIIIF